MVELSETAETEHFAEVTTSHILRHWKYNTTVRLYNVKTNFIPTASTGQSHTKTVMERKQQVSNTANVVVLHVQMSVDIKTTDPKITEEMVITGAFGTSGTNKYVMTLKEYCVESLSCIIKVLESVIIQPDDGTIKEQTHKKHSVARRIRY